MARTVSLLVFLTACSIFLLAAPASAKVSVEVSNNAEGSENSVNVQSSSSNSSTDVRIETNGEVKTYHAEGDEAISVHSSDGDSKVEVKSNAAGSKSTTRPTVTPTPTATPSPTSAPTPEPDVLQPEPRHFDFFEFIKEQLSFFNFFDN